MSALLEAPPEEMTRAVAAPPRLGALRRPLVACAVLLVLYVALSFLNHPGGYLGTDTGGKVATLKLMAEEGRFDPDIGYWAEQWDPDGTLHPLRLTIQLGDKWVNVTTLPALAVGWELYRIGGYRLALLVPMIGSVLAALAAAALHRRISPDSDGMAAFWLVGLASPLTIYALDFWEHSLGVALMAWATVLALDVIGGDRRLHRGVVMGLLLGAAATMRTEALVYGSVIFGVTGCTVLARRAEVRRAFAIGVLAVVALTGLLVANHAFETAVIGEPIRTGRATSTAAQSGNEAEARIREAGLMGLAIDPANTPATTVVGAALLGLLIALARRSHGPPDRVALLCAGGVAVLYLMRFVGGGPGFVPGLTAATPLAAIALARWPRGNGRSVVLIALISLPLVWATDYYGGAQPQWAGRYILASGLLLGVAGIARLPRLASWVRNGFVVVAAAVTVFGLSWLSIRSHDVANATDTLLERPEEGMVFDLTHLPREMGAVYRTDRRWLSVGSADEERQAVEIMRAAGVRTFAIVAVEMGQGVTEFPGTRSLGRERVPLFDGVPLRVTTYRTE